jgi:ABC-type antimicrobial peptide transport system permease subunit
VSGILKMPDENSDFYFSDFISLASARHSSLQDKIDLEHWANTNSSAQLFIKIKPGVSADQIESQFAPLIDLYNAENEDPSWIYNFRLQPLSDLHYNSKIGIFDSSPWPTANKSTLRILLLVSLLLLAIAIVNFINLETARATQRAKDIGIRKTLGSSRLALITQYFGEALLLTFSAIAISIGLADLGCRYFSEFLPTGFELDLFSVFGITTIILLWLSVSLLSGIYPALIITKYDATSAVSGVNLATGKSRLRHGLIIFQFVIAQFFIAATIFVSRQINHVLEKDLGFSTDAIINIGFPRQADKSTRMVFAENLANIPGIVQISTHDETPARRGWSSSTMTYLKDDSSKIELNVYRKFGDEKFIPLYDINLVAGQNFRTSDSLTELVINQTYAKQLGFSNEADAIGVTIELNDQKIPIVGVVKDFNFKSLRDHIEPVALGISRQCNMVSIKLASSDLSINGLDHIVESVEANWKQHFPNEEFQYAFYDEAIAKFYDGEKRIAKLLKAVTTIVILISCLGLLGLVTFMTERRRKEIGIRKVLGATSLRILYLLSGDFLLLILISLVIATPICWYFINQWLKNFAYHTNISWWVFFVTGLCSIMIALVTISSQGLKAALANPVDSLRNE